MQQLTSSRDTSVRICSCEKEAIIHLTPLTHGLLFCVSLFNPKVYYSVTTMNYSVPTT